MYHWRGVYCVHNGFVTPLIWNSVLLYLRSPKGGCCSISDDLSCSLTHGVQHKDSYMCPRQIIQLRLIPIPITRILVEGDISEVFLHVHTSHLRNEYFFSRFMRNESQCATNKSREPRSGSRAICLFRTAIHFPWTEKKRHSFLIFNNASNKDPFSNSPSKVRNSNFPQKSGTWPYFQTRQFSLTQVRG